MNNIINNNELIVEFSLLFIFKAKRDRAINQNILILITTTQEKAGNSFTSFTLQHPFTGRGHSHTDWTVAMPPSPPLPSAAVHVFGKGVSYVIDSKAESDLILCWNRSCVCVVFSLLDSRAHNCMSAWCMDSCINCARVVWSETDTKSTNSVWITIVSFQGIVVFPKTKKESYACPNMCGAILELHCNSFQHFSFCIYRKGWFTRSTKLLYCLEHSVQQGPVPLPLHLEEHFGEISISAINC